MDLAFAPAQELARRVRDRETTARDLLEMYLDRVARLNPAVNAVVELRADAARAEADAADAELAGAGPRGPLHGVPMTVKESFDLAGTPTTWGMPALRDNRPETTALAVQRLQAAGAVVFGKTNVPLMLADWQSFNDIHGTCNNPWDPARGPGGSSGGAAAALAAGLTGLELGSDIGASIRNPAHYCGVYGHKPTYGVVPVEGQRFPGAVTDPDIAVAGPLARAAEDLAVSLDVTAGPGSADAAAWRLDLPRPRKTDLSQFRVGVMLTDPNCDQDSELTDRLQTTVDTLARAGVQVDDRARPPLDTTESHRVYLTLLRAATHSRLPREVFERHREAAAARADDDFSYAAMVDRAASLHHRDWIATNEARGRLRLAWAEFFRDYDLLLCPAAASAAFPHDHEGERADRTILIDGQPRLGVDQLFWAGLPGVVFLPATVAPAGLTRSGLPCGLQIVGPYLEDHTCIEFARLMAGAVGGFQPPPGYD
ncbi:MAG: amidase [Hyphomicrobiales bacterium]|nr:amidase [Hyphomicrobiales bacterium]